MSPRRALLLAVFVLAACSDGDLRRVVINVEVPPQLDFGTVNVGTRTVSKVVVKSLSAQPVKVLKATVTAGAEAFQVASAPQTLPPGEASIFEVAFTPATSAPYAGELTLSLESVDSDAESATRTVALIGSGGVATLELDDTLDFGLVNEGSPAERTFALSNTGLAPLTVSALALEGTDADTFALAPVELPARIPAGEKRTLTLTCDVKRVGAPEAALVVTSDAVGRATARVTLMAQANLRPIAHAVEVSSGAASVTLDLRSTARLSAEGSSDPESGALSYLWKLAEKPAGSAATFSAATASDPNFRIDVPGTYRASLVVTDPQGLASVPAEVVVSSIRDWAIMLTWDASTDLDLHFVRPDGTLGDNGCAGSPVVCSGSDCSFQNRSPDWPGGNPSLDVDSTTRGPETTSIDAPAEGDYRIFVHYCGIPGRDAAAVNATVTVLHHGQAVRTFGPAKLEGVNAVWEVARLSVPADTLAAVDAFTNESLCR